MKKKPRFSIGVAFSFCKFPLAHSLCEIRMNQCTVIDGNQQLAYCIFICGIYEYPFFFKKYVARRIYLFISFKSLFELYQVM